MEKRFTNIAPAHVRGAASVRTTGSNAIIAGYAARWYFPDEPGTEYRLGPGLVERIVPGAFSKTIRGDDVRGLLNHDPSSLLGRTKSGTLTLSQDGRGLHYRIALPATQLGQDVGVLIARGDLSQASFAFDVVREKRDWEGKTEVRWLRELRLYDISVVSFPAYEATTAELTYGSMT